MKTAEILDRAKLTIESTLWARTSSLETPPITGALTLGDRSISVLLDNIADSLRSFSSDRPLPRVEFAISLPVSELDLRAIIQQIRELRLILFDVLERHSSVSDEERNIILSVLDDFIAQVSQSALEQIRLERQNTHRLQAARFEAETARDHFFNLPDLMLCIAGNDGYFKRLTSAWEHTLGFSIPELTARPWIDFVHPEDRELTLREGERLRAGASTREFRNRYACKAGGYKWLYWSCTPVDGVLYAVARDVTKLLESEKERDRLLAEVQRKEEDLRRSNEELARFAQVASHDLQEPLRMVSSYLNLLQNRHGHCFPKQALEYMDFAKEGARRMQELITAILSLSRTGVRGNEFRKVDCAVVAETAVQQLQVSIHSSGSEVFVKPLPVIQGDPSLLIQLFQNLVGNAIKYRRKDSICRVAIEADRREGNWCFKVSDNGSGFDMSHASEVFQPFRRLHGRDYPGNGIGLAICKRIVDVHGGNIWVESKPEKGSTFYFTLPAISSEEEVSVVNNTRQSHFRSIN